MRNIYREKRKVYILSNLLLILAKIIFLTKQWKIILQILLFTASIHGQSITNFNSNLDEAAMTLTKQKVKYDPSYFNIKYPNGDVPSDKGVCTDVVIRAFRIIGIDLQKEVHLDMKSQFEKYPNHWKQKQPDSNIDHRRVHKINHLVTLFGGIWVVL